jgi:hypothetical protein
MSSRLLTAIVMLFIINPLTVNAQTSPAEESSSEIVFPQHIQDRLDFKNNVAHSLKDAITPEDKVSAKAKYSHIDPTKMIPPKLREDALAYFDANKKNFANQNYIAIINFSAHSSKPRFYLVNMASGKVQAYRTAHGKGSDTNNDGYAERFSNTSGSEMSSVGYYRVAETYNGKYGYSVRLDGLSATNSRARSRAIVIHPAPYVSESSGRAGRSWGCPALDAKYSAGIISALKNGAMLYANVNK